jgi:hypothetical protein
MSAVIVCPPTIIVMVMSRAKKSFSGLLPAPSVAIIWLVDRPLLKLVATPELKSWSAHTVIVSPLHLTPPYLVVDLIQGEPLSWHEMIVAFLSKNSELSMFLLTVGLGVVGAVVTGAGVVGWLVVGAVVTRVGVVGWLVVGEFVTGASVVGWLVVGESVTGAAVVGRLVVGAGASVIGWLVVGAGATGAVGWLVVGE